MIHHPHLDWVQTLAFIAPKVLFSILCGGLVGLERELKNKPAGIKTNILICVGSTLFTAMGVLIAATHSDTGHYGDPGRLAAQIVSGIGFLGGGTIIQARGTILGLTTAATIWVVAAIGVMIGTGYPEAAILSSVSVVLILILSSAFEDRVLGRSLKFACEILVHDPQGRVRTAINEALARNELLLDDFDIRLRGVDTELTVRFTGHRGDYKKFILELWSTQGVKEVKQL